MCIDLYIYSCSCRPTYHVLYICYFCMFELYSVQDPAFVTAPMAAEWVILGKDVQ